MEKNKEDGMTDLEIIKKNFNIITDSESAGYDYWYELEKEALDAATRMAAEIEDARKTSLQWQNSYTQSEKLRYTQAENDKFEIERLKAALTKRTDVLEKIARELEKANKLKALSFRKDSYVELDEVDEIMED